MATQPLPGIPATITGPKQGPPPGQVSVTEFASSLKKAMPELAQFPDQAVVDRYLVAFPQFKAKVAQAPQETFLQKTWPTDAHIGPPEQLHGLAAVRQVLEDARNKFATKLFGTQPEGGAGELLGSPVLGPLKAARGAVDLARSAGGEGPGWWSGTKDVLGGGLQTASVPLSFMAPEVAGERGAFKPLEAPAAVRKLTDIVNPAAQDRGEFLETLSKHYGKVVTWAQRNGMRISDPEQLIAAMRDTGNALKTHFDARILNPVRDTPVSASSMPSYAGKGVAGMRGEGATITLGDLYDRLTEIHGELYNLRNQTGEAAKKALMSAGDLKAEADQIRHVFYDTLSKATGIPRNQLAEIREAYGELDTAAKRGQLALDTAQHAKNVAAKGTPRTWRRVVLEGIQRRSPSAVQAREAKTVEQTMQDLGRYGQDYQPPPAYSPSAPEAAARFPRPRPMGPEGIQVNVEEPSAAAREAQLNKLAQRGQAVQAAKATKAARLGAGRLIRDVGEETTLARTETTEAERAAHAEKLAKRAAAVKKARAERMRQIAEARAARQRPPE